MLYVHGLMIFIDFSDTLLHWNIRNRESFRGKVRRDIIIHVLYDIHYSTVCLLGSMNSKTAIKSVIKNFDPYIKMPLKIIFNWPSEITIKKLDG